MPLFSDNDINEAKRRVREMQNRARELTEEQPKINNNPAPQPFMPKQEDSDIKKTENKMDSEQDDKSSWIILALILLLSKEEADSMLILALLYLLF